MRKTEFLQELKEALEGEVSPRVIQENLNYYNSYISQEAAKGRGEEEVIEELGGPRIIARTIIDSSEAAGEAGPQESYAQSAPDYGQQDRRQNSGFHYIDLNKWYWKLLAFVIVISILFIVMTVVGGIFSLLFRFAGPLLIIWLIYTMIKGMRR